MTVTERVQALRAELARRSWSAFLTRGSDPHDSEYPPARWQTRPYLSGFTGSAGTVMVTTDQAGLWTDGRYFQQAEAELAGSGLTLFREGLPGTPSPAEWLADTLPRGAVIGVDARTTSLAAWEQFQREVEPAGLRVDAADDPLDAVWSDRPAAPSEPVWDYQTAVTGLSPRSAKLADLNKALERLGAEAHLVTALDDLAWLFNLRGADVADNPVFLGLAWVAAGQARLYLQVRALEPAARDALARDGVTVHPYEALEGDLATLSAGRRVLAGSGRTSVALCRALDQAGARRLDGPSPLLLAKAVKSPAELDLVRQAHLKDAAALAAFLHWWDQGGGEGWTEQAVADHLEGFRRTQPGYRGRSFTPIPGWKANGAIIHYHTPAGGGAQISGRGLLLLDTGTQYLEGTTDVTRVLLRGEALPLEVEDYTQVLKAHVQVSLMPFPVGTRGYTVDAFARHVLWKTGRHYNHGTGHGVGQFLGVHEPSARLSLNPEPQVLLPGMLLSNEPGVYRPGQHGVRLENLVTVVPAGETGFARFLGWETLTLAPFERRLIDESALDPEERAWVDAYHQRVLAEVGPLVPAPVRDWLERACRPL